MISGINQSNSMYSYQATLNQMRLNQVMNRRTGTQAVQPVRPLQPTPNQLLTDSISYVDSYSSSMTDLMSSANSLRDVNAAGVSKQLTTTSSDRSVVSAESHYRQRSPETYEVDVSQLAAAQTNVSTAVKSTDTASDVSMQIQTNKGTIDIAVSAVDSSGKQKSNSQVLSDTAKAINNADSGVKASVITKDGKSSLQITAAKTGESNQFSVSGAFADSSGLTNVSQAAQNAKYTVTKDGAAKSYTSDSNQVKLDYGKVDATLKKIGSATVTIGADTDKVVAAMEDLVNSYNNTAALLSKNADRGGGTSRQLSRLNFVLGPEEDRELLGISVKKDGTLSLDKDKLTESLKKDPDLTKDLISGSHGIAQRAYSSAQNGLSASVSSLISNDLNEAAYSQMTSPINAMNTYSRAGSYNMMNYYSVGMMLNAYV